MENQNKKKNPGPIIAIAICAAIVVLGVGIKAILASAPGARNGLGSPGDVLFNTTILYDSMPSEYTPNSAFMTGTGGATHPQILGPYVGTIASINDIAGMTGTVATAHLYYGYNWCKKYPADLDCQSGRMPLCLIAWAPTAPNADKTYQSCYSAHTTQPGNTKAWRSALDSDIANVEGYSQVWQLQVIMSQPGIAGLDEIAPTI